MARGQNRSMPGPSAVKLECVEHAGRKPNAENVQDALQAAGIDASVTRDEFGAIRIVTSSQRTGCLLDYSPGTQYQHTFDSLVCSVPRPALVPSQRDAPYVCDYVDDEESAVDSSSARSSKAKPSQYRVPRQRPQGGHFMLPRDGTRYLNTPNPPSPFVKELVSSDAEEEESMPQKRRQKAFRIEETSKVIEFISSRLKRMQQLADKKIAKAWIKGICPKKQAKFPYQNNKRGTENGKVLVVPGWWPQPETVCRFVEPDHIRRGERMMLCIHLLRLRPSPKQLQEWNGNTHPPHPTHVLYGWTAFLRELAGAEIFEELPKESSLRIGQRQELMQQMYDVAQLEQDYLDGVKDGDTIYSYTEDPEERKTVLVKRSRQASIASSMEPESRQSSVSCERFRKVAKRSSVSEAATSSGSTQCRKLETEVMTSQSSRPASAKHEMIPSNMSFDFGGELDTVTGSGSADPNFPRNTNPVVEQYEAVPMKRDSSMQSQLYPQTYDWSEYPVSQWTDNPSSASSFCEDQVGSSDPYQTGNTQATFPGRQDYDFAHYQQPQEGIQVQQAAQIPHPNFATVPTTPIFHPESLMPMMPVNNFAMHQQCETGPSHQQAYTEAMPSSQYFMPAQRDSTVADFHHPTNRNHSPYRDMHGMAERHMAPIQCHGLPYGQPQTAAWNNHRVAGHNPM